MPIKSTWLLVLLVLLSGCGEAPPSSSSSSTPSSALAPTPITSVLGLAADGFTTVTEPRPFSFPADHGAHPDYRTEWWYWTGNLATADGRAFGYQFTIFRFALAPTVVPRASAWATSETWLAHLTISDIAGKKFYAFERSARGALGLAGAGGDSVGNSMRNSMRIHCDGWEASGGGPWRIHAETPEVALDLRLDLGKPVVLQGDRGLSRKDAAAGAASYYYSFTRMPTTGTLRLGEQRWALTGNSWMDREWSTSALAPGVVGWDWFALQLADGRELMFYRLRRPDGSATEFSSGSLVAVDGTVRSLTAAEVSLTSTGQWTSASGVTYPAGWHLRAADLDLQIVPRLADQELNLSVRYWEGAVTVSGSVGGVGYVELAGYGSRAEVSK
jgi:predicted secreted hydrolase